MTTFLLPFLNFESHSKKKKNARFNYLFDVFFELQFSPLKLNSSWSVLLLDRFFL